MGEKVAYLSTTFVDLFVNDPNLPLLILDLSKYLFPYHRLEVGKQSGLSDEIMPLITYEYITRVGNRVRIYFPIFIRDLVVETLRKYGYNIMLMKPPIKRISIPFDNVKLYPFQEDAVNSFIKSGCRGTIVVPTGGGKTFIALKVISLLKVSTLIVVTTQELVNQWCERLIKYLGIEPGVLMAGVYDIRDVTVSTYHSAVDRIFDLMHKFTLIIFDEVHHCPSDLFKEIGFRLDAPFRLGLSATIQRSDNNEHLVYMICGPIVYKATYRDLVKYGLTVPIRHYVIYVLPTPDEFEEYMTCENPIKRRNIALSSKSKDEVVEKIVLTEYKLGSKILIFCEFIEQAERIYQRLAKYLRNMVCLLTGETNKEDRGIFFEYFRQGKVRVLVTTRVLDEGIDVPDANVAIIVSGSSCKRQMIQRIGRVCRATNGKKEARVYEIVTASTCEEGYVEKRHFNDEVYEIECVRVRKEDLDKLLHHIVVTVLKNQQITKLKTY